MLRQSVLLLDPRLGGYHPADLTTQSEVDQEARPITPFVQRGPHESGIVTVSKWIQAFSCVVDYLLYRLENISSLVTRGGAGRIRKVRPTL